LALPQFVVGLHLNQARLLLFAVQEARRIA
jgi:hypothetical protein